MTSKTPSRRVFRRVSTAAILTTGIVSLVQQQQAQAGTTYNKSAVALDNWNGATWTPTPAGGYPNAAGDIAQYSSTTVNSNTTLNVDVTIGQIQRTGSKTWGILTDGVHVLTLDNTTNNSANVFTGSLAAITSSATTNNSLALTVGANIIIGNSGASASPGLVVGSVASGAITTPGNVVISGSITGTGALYAAGGTASGGTGANASTITFSGLVNNTGTINVGRYQSGSAIQNGTGNITFSGGIGSNVTSFTTDSTTATASVSGAVAVNASGTTFINTQATKGLTVTGAVTGSGNLILQTNAAVPVTNLIVFSTGGINNTGAIINNGTGTTAVITNTSVLLGSSVTISGPIGTNVTGLTQNAASSIVLSGANTFAAPISVLNGGLVAGASNSAFGAATNVITLGASSGSANAAVFGNGGTTTVISNPITVAGGSTGNTLTIAGSTASNLNYAGLITLNHDLSIRGIFGGTTTTFSGGFDGTGNITASGLDNNVSGGTITISGLLNNAGTFTFNGTSAGTPVNLSGGVGSNVTSITDSAGGTGSLNLAGNLVVNAGGTALVSTSASGTSSFIGAGGISGTGNLTVAANSSASITLTGAVNNTGTVTGLGTGSGAQTLGAIGSNVTAVSQTGVAPFTVGAVTLGANETFTSNNTGLFTIGGITGTGNVVLNANSTGNITVSTGTINNTGTIINSGTGTNVVALTSVIGNNVGAITQTSTTSQLNINGANTTFAGGVVIKQGTVLGQNNSAFGTAAIQLGDTAANANDASLRTNITSGNVTNAIQLQSGTTGRLIVGINNNSSSGIFSGGVTGSNNLYLNNSSNQTMTFTVNAINNTGVINNISTGTGAVQIQGGIGTNVTGVNHNGAGGFTITTNPAVFTGNIVLNGTGVGTVSLGTSGSATGVINNTGTITNMGTTTGATTVSGTIGSNVSQYIQNSTTSSTSFSQSGNAFGNLIVKAGTASTGNRGFGAGTITLGDAAGADATLLVTASQNVTNAITLGTNAVGTLSIATTSTTTTGIFSGAIDTNGRTLSLDQRSTGTVTFSGPVSGTGSVSNIGTGTGSVVLSGVIANTVAGVSQNSPTSTLVLQANNLFNDLYINNGTVTGNNSANVSVNTAYGAGTIHLGANSSTANATLQSFGANSDQITNPVVLGNTSGVLTINNLNSGTTATFGALTGSNSVTVSSGVGTSGTTFASANITGTLTNSTATGTGPVTITNGMTGGSVNQNSASSALVLPGNNTYTGTTTVTQGTLSLSTAGTLGGTAISVNGGTFLAPGANTIGTGGSSPTVVVNGANLSLVSNSINNLNINSGTPGATVLTFAGGTYSLDVSGALADEIVLGSGLMADGGASTVTVSPTFVTAPTTGSRTILLAPGGLSNAGSFQLNAASGNFGGNTVSLSSTATTLDLNVTAAATHSLLYFTGAIDNTFTTFTGGNTNNSNFSTDQAGTLDAHAGPDSTTELHFTATSLASISRSVAVNTAQQVESIIVDSNVVNPLTLAPGTAGTLTLNPSSATRGITNSAGTGGTLTVSAPVILNGNGAFTNTTNSTAATALFSVSGAISGTGNLAIRSNGDTTVSNSTVITLSGGVNNTGSITNNGTGTATGTGITHGVTISGAIGSNVTSVTQNSANTGLNLTGSASNTYTGLTTSTLGQLRLGKTAGLNAIGGNLLVNGGSVALLANNQIPDTATVTITSGIFNSSTATVINTGASGVEETFATLNVSGSGIYQNAALNTANGAGLVVSGVATFTGGSGAAFFTGSAAKETFGTLVLNDLSTTNQSSTPSVASVANSFVVFGNSTTRQGVASVGTGGLFLNANTTNNYLSLRKGSSTSVLGSKLTLEGDVTSSGSGSFSNFIMQDTGAGSIGSISVDLAGTSTGAVSRTFNTNINLTVAVPINNGTSSAGSIVKTGSATLVLDRITGTAQNTASAFTGSTNINAGTIRASATGVLATTSGITINNSGSLLLGNTLNSATSSTDRVGDAVPVTVNSGGTLGVATTTLGGSTGTSSLSETMGNLTLSSGSTLDFGTGNTDTLQFAGLTSSLSGLSLSIAHWSGATYLTTATADSGLSTQDRFLFAAASDPGYTDAQLAGISFTDDSGAFLGSGHQVLFSPGVYEIVPVAIPEPSTIFSAIFAVGLIGFRERRRIGKLVTRK